MNYKMISRNLLLSFFISALVCESAERFVVVRSIARLFETNSTQLFIQFIRINETIRNKAFRLFFGKFLFQVSNVTVILWGITMLFPE